VKFSRAEWAFLALACLATVAAAAPWIGELGMEYDEAHFLDSATRIAATHPEKLAPPDGFYVAHRPFPFMTMIYVGALDGWLLAPILALFGYSPLVPRIACLLAGCGIPVLTYALARRLGGVWAGAIAVAMLVVDLEWLIHLPVHFGPFLLQIACAGFAYWQIDRWLEQNRPSAFYWACFAAGLGFQEKLTFVWVLAVLTLALLVFRGREIFRAMTLRRFAIGFAIFLAAMSPALWYAIGNRDRVFGYGGESTVLPTLDVLAKRFAQFEDLLAGQRFVVQQLGTVGVERISALPILFWGAVAVCVLLRVWTAAPLLFFTVALVALNALFPEGGRLHHLLLAYPLLQVGVGVALAARAWLRIPALILIAITGVSTAHNLAWYSGEIHRTGGRGHWSSAIYDVAEWMKTQPETRFVGGAWGFYRQLYFLTGGRISIHDRYFDLLPNPMPPDNRREVATLVKRRETVWLTSEIMPQYVSNREHLFAVAREFGLEPRLLKTFHEKTGEPIYRAWTFLPEESKPWRPIPAGGSEFALPSGTRDVRFTVDARQSVRRQTLTVEFLDANGERLRAWWRTLEYFAITPRTATMAFGDDLYPDYFVPLPGTRDGEPAKVRILPEPAIPLSATDVRVR
jgi:4-amino-4-deoxy-L-arabinose transferase-like glycosyltransferase